MIVKNESRNMKRLFDSVISIIDMISIVDTGSTDDTPDVITQWGLDNNIPTTVHHEPFKNFSYNRTHSVRMAKIAYPNADYFLLSDADFIWEIDVGQKFDKVLLTDHKYLINQHNLILDYWNVRLLSSKVDWECVGVTHEYWTETKKQQAYDGDIRVARLSTLAIDDREDGGCKSDKFERDERLLRGGLADENTPADVKTRYKFYLAQTLKDFGKYHDSITWYFERIKDHGWYEEVFYAKYQIGVNYEQLAWKYKQCIFLLGKEDLSLEEGAFLSQWNSENYTLPELLNLAKDYFKKAEVSYMTAYEYNKNRIEPLCKLVTLYRTTNQYQKAYDVAHLGKGAPYPYQDSLFIERGCYDYMMDFELSIICYYLEEKFEEGREIIQGLLQRTDLPEHITKAVVSNANAYESV
jgi:glycosyltransferase involved in cell wall biosynthesis